MQVKKALLIVISGIALLIIANLYYYRDTYYWQIDTQTHVLKKEVVVCNELINSYFTKTQTSLALSFSEKEIESFFENPGKSIETQRKIEYLFTRRLDYIKELRIYNENGKCFWLRKGVNNTVIANMETSDGKTFGTLKKTINVKDKEIVFVQSLAYNLKPYAKVEFKMDLDDFFNFIFRTFNLEQYKFQWVVNSAGDVVFSTIPISLKQNKSNNHLNDNLKLKKSFTHLHDILLGGEQTKVVTALLPINFSNDTYFIAFSLPTDLITVSIARNAFFVGSISLIIFISILVFFFIFIRKRIKSENIAKQNQEALRKMIYYLPAGILLIDNNNKIVSVNRSFLKIFEFDDEDLLVGHPMGESLLFSNTKLINKEKFSDYSLKYVVQQSSNNEGVIFNDKIPYFLDQKRYLIDVYTEIPIQSAPKSTLEQRQAQTAFIANISHELRTPLNGIIGMSDLLYNSSLPPAENEMMGILKRSADTLLLLINDILDFSKIESGKFDVESIAFDLKTEIEQTIQGFMPQAKEKGITLTYKLPSTLPIDFIGDPIRTKQVLNNLLSNAIKFTEKGKVHLLVTNSRLLNGNEGLLFSVKDTGIGIDKEKQKYIFNSFYQADESTTRQYGGTGLGTTISKELVKLLGGEIWINSPCDLSSDPEFPGSEFCFTLPLLSRKQLKSTNIFDVKEFNQLRAIIITDDVLQVNTITQNFIALGVDYRIMSPSRDTIDLLRTTNRYHLLVIDNRTDFSGIEFLQEIYNNQLHKNFIILFQSSDQQKSNTNHVKRLGADAYLRKPIRLVVLRDFLFTHFTNISDKNSSLPATHYNKELKILVVEDNVLNQRVAQNLFQRIGFEIDIASNGEEAVNIVKKTKYDIIFMDIYMPHLDGIEAVKQIKLLGVQCPIVAMTASIDPYEKQRALSSGLDDYVNKPARPEDILRMITKWCHRGI